MHPNQIISHTPAWVWALFAYLMMSGVKALRSRKMTPEQMLILPIFFLAWALYGIAGSWVNALRLPVATFDVRTCIVTRPGSVTTLVLVMVGFFSKYILSVVLVLHPSLGAQEGFAIIFGGVTGLLDGVFWGSVILQYRQAFHRIKIPVMERDNRLPSSKNSPVASASRRVADRHFPFPA